MLRDKKLEAKANESTFKDFTQTFVARMGLVDNIDEANAHQDNLTILMENYTNNLNSKGKKSVRSITDFFISDVDFEDKGQVEFLLEDKIEGLFDEEATELFNLTEDYIANYQDTLKSKEVSDIILTGQVYSQLLTHQFAVVRASDKSDSMIFSNYTAVVAVDRGFLKAGDDVFENIDGYFTSDRVFGEPLWAGDGVATTFVATTVAHLPIKPYNFEEGEYVVVEYIAGGVASYLYEMTEGQLFDPLGVTQHGTVSRANGTVAITAAALPVAPDNGTELIGVYSFVLRDHSDIATVSFNKTETTVFIETNKVMFKSTFDAEEAIKRNGAVLTNYIESVKQAVIRNNIDIRNLNRIYRAARNTSVVWDKTIPAGTSATEHYASLKFALSEVIGLVSKKRDKNIKVKYKAFTSTRVVSFLESLADSGSEVYTITNNVSENSLGLGDSIVAGYSYRNKIETFCAPFLDVDSRPSVTTEPIQSDNEMVIAAVPVGKDSEIRIPAVFVIYELLRYNGEQRDIENDMQLTSFTSQTGFKVIDDRYFAILVINNM